MGSRTGYEHRYSFSTDDELIPFYNTTPFEYLDKPLLKQQFKGFAFEIRTRFLLKTILDDDVIIDTEKFVSGVPITVADCRDWLESDITYRLSEYWMLKDEISSLAHEAFDFAERNAVDNPKYASLDINPIVVGIDVVTVQLEGETVNDARGRVISPGCMIRLDMCPMVGLLRPFRPPWLNEVDIWKGLIMFVLHLPVVRVRVENADRLGLMDECPICLRGPTIGARLSPLPCKHFFHNHCVVQWLLLEKSKKSCPVCRYEIVV
ncbi:hypothetical protein CASFOL_029127 [Castilleja foliolosa]|uniref:RING-type domain-containing protein n=1 Tax=Castilleja foliolosa TaxID=1961234 RepID=A0ABD3CDY9_9LAMI